MSKFMRCKYGRRDAPSQRAKRIRRNLVFSAASGQQSLMRSIVQVTVHATQFPENVRRALLSSLRTRRVNHKFLYDGIKHTQKWLALHDAYSPARVDADCVAKIGRAHV